MTTIFTARSPHDPLEHWPWLDFGDSERPMETADHAIILADLDPCDCGCASGTQCCFEAPDLMCALCEAALISLGVDA